MSKWAEASCPSERRDVLRELSGSTMGVDKLLGADTHVIVLEAVVAETAVTLVKVDHPLFPFLDLHLTRIYAELRGKYNMPKLGNQNVRNI